MPASGDPMGLERPEVAKMRKMWSRKPLTLATSVKDLRLLATLAKDPEMDQNVQFEKIIRQDRLEASNGLLLGHGLTHTAGSNIQLKLSVADKVRSEISAEIREAECFALMVDETKDVSKSEQLSIVVRYLKGEQVREEFLHFRSTEGLDANSLLSTIKQTLSQCNIDPTAIHTD
ncbi:hypothetical protein KUCAC02_021111 [Chaenocephalus aceratus]|uniref:Uncharacterized protein n=1 Tax=Chaenocephalus aceratus TaxID=36190 RepID=A0ACB9XFN9_CHAAC|nr:hypothetical protein KUCAC02_021111 [Chaenocephalus aceratus]